jgi:ABC-2 type transport system permease protein
MKNKKKQNSLTELGIAVLILVLLNVLSGFVFLRVDLTAENRYSLSGATKDLLKEVDDIIFFKIYLDGEFPAGFKKLKRETREMLDEFRAYNKNIEYEFIDPTEVGDQEEQRRFFNQLVQKGLTPTDLHFSGKQGASQKIVFPGALVTYRDRELPVHFLVRQRGQSAEQALNQSVQNLEYNIANVIQKLLMGKKKSVAFVEGHGELAPNRTVDIEQALGEYYQVERVRIDGRINALTERKTSNEGKVLIANKYDVAIVAKPDSVFSDKDKFILDQYVMYGGNVLWLVDPIQADMDSLENKARTLGMARDLSLQDLFFNYGFRINTQLLLDLNCASLPIVTGNVGGQPRQQYLPWVYFPVLIPRSHHPIVANLNNVRTEFPSTIDTINTPGISKTILLQSSKYSKTINAPALISLEKMKEKPSPDEYNQPPQTVGLLLEGTFTSFYQYRLPPELTDNELIGFKETSEPTRMVVFSDGDIIKNQLHYSRGYPLPLGYDQFTGQTFGNKDLILNAVNYLTYETGILAARSKDFKIRLLDNAKVSRYRVLAQVVNTAGTVVLVLVVVLILMYLRRKKYTSI